MDSYWMNAVRHQFGAAIDMLEEALIACPDDLWSTCLWNDPLMPPEFSEFWYVAFHTIFWLDLYLSGEVEGFEPPFPFTLDELIPEGKLPERSYTRAELIEYLAYCRIKCYSIIELLTNEKAERGCYFPWRKNSISFAELILDNMRHVQEHGAQLNMILGQKIGVSANWFSQGKDVNK